MSPGLRTLYEYLLIDAITRYRHTRFQRRLRLQTEHEELCAWFAARTWSDPFSFSSTCYVLRLDPDAVWRPLQHSNVETLHRPLHHRTHSREVSLAERFAA